MSYVKAIYDDLSIWEGDVSEWPLSPEKGILVIMVWIDTGRIVLSGYDHYAVELKDGKLKLAKWTGHLHVIEDGKEAAVGSYHARSSFPKANIRLGAFVDDDVYEESLRTAMAWRR